MMGYHDQYTMPGGSLTQTVRFGNNKVSNSEISLHLALLPAFSVTGSESRASVMNIHNMSLFYLPHSIGQSATDLYLWGM